MGHCSRRSFIRAMSVIPFAVWFEEYAAAEAPLVRYDATSPEGRAMLASYARGVAAMKGRPDDDPISWTFQWYTHCVKDPKPPYSRFPGDKSAEIARVYAAPSASRKLAEEVWSSCQNHGNGVPGMKEDYFLPWHRMYVYFFERIVRKASGDKSFTLPYWNYSVTGASHGVMPQEFRTPSNPSLKSLYVDKRNARPNVNGGDAIDKNDAGALDVDALAQCTYSPVSDAQQGFCATLDFGLHGNVHGLIGARMNMGVVPWAAGDPVFWMHHSNIDRLWASWNKAGRKNPDDPGYLQQQFTFADENGQRVVGTNRDFLDISKLGYSYATLEAVPQCPVPEVALFEAATHVEQFATSPRVSLSTVAPVKVRLKSLPHPDAKPGLLSARVTALEGQKRLYLVLKNLQAKLAAGVLYHIFFGLPDNASAASAEKYRVGVINFFDVPAEEAQAKMKAKTFSFDVTALAKRLAAQIGEEPVVVIKPSGDQTPDAVPVIGEISLLSQ